MRARLLLVLAATATLAPASGARAQEPVLPIGTPEPLPTARLSDELTITRFAHSRSRAQILRHPRAGARAITRLHPLTEDGLPEVYIVLSSWVDEQGQRWLRIRIPMRPNGVRGWVRREALGPLHLVRTHLVIDRHRLVATLTDAGRVVWRAHVGVGKASTPTPRGSFYVRERLRVSQPDTIYGPWAFGTSAYSVLTEWPGGGVVGIHGTNEPQLIPGRPSHGCVRLRNAAVSRLARLMPVGTPVRIL